MKQLVVVAFVLLGLSAGAQNIEPQIKDIRAWYKDIVGNLTSFDTTMVYIGDESTEGGEGIAYYRHDELLRIDVKLYGEMGRSEEEFYFHEGKLFFVFHQTFHYNAPIYLDPESAAEMEMEPFSSEKTVVSPHRFYFHQDKLIRWLDHEKNEVPRSDPNFAREESSNLEEAKLRRALFKK